MINKKSILYSICFMLLIDSIGLGIILPIMPELFINNKSGLILVNTYFSREILYSLCLALFPLASMFGMPILGGISDRYGRSKIILYALGALTVAYLLSMAAVLLHNVWLFLLTRLLTGFLCGTYSVANALISDMHDNDQDRMSSFKLPTLISVLGFIVSPGLSIFVNDIKINNPLIVPFFIAFLLSSINLIMFWNNFKNIKEKHIYSNFDLEKDIVAKINIRYTHFIQSKAKEIFILLGYAFNNQSTRMLAFAYLLFQLGFGLFLQSLSLCLALKHNYNPSKIATFSLIMAIAMTISMYTLQNKASKYIIYNTQVKFGLLSISILLILESICCRTTLSILQLDYIYILWATAVIFYILLPFITLGFTNLFINSVSKKDQGKIMGGSGQICSLSFFISGMMIGKVIMDYDFLLLIVGVTFIASYGILNKVVPNK